MNFASSVSQAGCLWTPVYKAHIRAVREKICQILIREGLILWIVVLGLLLLQWMS